MVFAEEHERWLTHHMDRRMGERRSRLERGHGHGERMFLERVWWPMFGQLDHLHPEYEVADWRGRPYFVDFVWKPGEVKYAIEVKGYGPHVQDMDRVRYRQELNREIYLQIAGYRVVSIAYDDLESNSALLMTLLKSLFMPHLAISRPGVDGGYTRLELDILQLAIRTDGYIRPVDLVRGLGVDARTVNKCMKSLCQKGKFKPLATKGNYKVHRYEYIPSFTDTRLW
ncbi:hypothetical protein [Paenibacillus donghaensis]|uniref:DUF559 domain-containing protein n=1 Tax=Paenibacillus donghaensis TaxID=414771 RepID=A0A2Z2KD63_9BACL|nr:hypothetical protein [Paenibacillus donghaensis]ASA19889.1 hypothetical protein B9T62_03160 [Paenibacillus donghaensis]